MLSDKKNNGTAAVLAMLEHGEKSTRYGYSRKSLIAGSLGYALVLFPSTIM